MNLISLRQKLWVARFFRQSLPGALGILLAVIASYIGLVRIPDWQVAPLKPVLVEPNELYPPALSREAEIGREVYVSLGCIYCHSQQVRQQDFGKDISRGYGRRGSVPLDYINEDTPLLGTMRTGPDLRNIGLRQPSRTWHLLHLYNPQITSAGSIMPPFPFLFREVKKDEVLQPPQNWVDVPDAFAPRGSYIAATEEAEALVAYLQSLQYDRQVPREALQTRSRTTAGKEDS